MSTSAVARATTFVLVSSSFCLASQFSVVHVEDPEGVGGRVEQENGDCHSSGNSSSSSATAGDHQAREGGQEGMHLIMQTLAKFSKVI